jgi:RND family efflux transporter MFP subunit
MMTLSLPDRIRWAMLAVSASLLPFVSGCDRGEANAQAAAPPPPAVSVTPVIKRNVQEFDEFTARLEAPKTVEIRSRVAGMLTRVHFREGQLVKQDDPLFTIDPRPFAAEVARADAQKAAAHTQVELNRSELARAEKLVPIRGVSAQEVDQLSSALRTAEANVKAAEAALVQARLNLEFSRITAPVAGRTSRANVTEGNLVGVGDPVLTTVVSNDKVYAYFDASEALYLKYVRAAREGTRSSSRDAPNLVRLGLANEQGYPHEGKMDFVDNRLNPVTASIRGRAVFDNLDGLYTPGLFARLQLVGSGTYSANLVPDRAITTDQTRKVVLVIGKNNIVEQREVKTGALFDGMRAVTGVNPGEMVIVDGLLRAFPGAPVTPQVLKLDADGRPIPAAPGAATPAKS